MLNRWRFLALPILSSAALASAASGQGYPPDEAAARMAVADGLAVELVACEPLVRQPVAIDFDDRGRLWVIQYLQYPNPAGLKRVQVDRYSRTVYDRVPEPPPHGPRGADRITILEDTDGDGRMDRGKDFVNGLNLTTGLAFGQGGLFVLNVPYLLFYPDRDHDDVPDADPKVLLEGFGMQDAHSVANSLTWGPDGWLYGCQGSTVTSKIRGIEFQQGVWRYHPRTREFELFCEGGGNSWGLDFDRNGRLLYSTNMGGFVMLHGLQGAYLWKSFGKHGALHNPYAFGYFDHVPHNGFRGGHVSVGGTFYEGTTFPPHFRGRYIAADLLGHAVYWHTLEPRGSTFRSAHGGELLQANDTWFGPTDVTLGPDGAIYLSDWHDRRTAHPDPDADWDRSNGRIYRIQAVGADPTAVPDLNKLTSDRLVDRLNDANGWIARRARRILAERRDPRVLPRLRRLSLEADDDDLALRALWALSVTGGFNDDVAKRLLWHRNEAVRAWTVRLLGDPRRVSAGLGRELAGLAKREPSAVVRSQLACTARRLPARDAVPILGPLLLRDEDRNDPYIPLLLWWAVEEHALAAQDELLESFASPMAWKTPLIREVILERLMRRYAAEGAASRLTACARLLAAAPDASARRRLLTALDEGLRLMGNKRLLVPKGTLFEQVAVPSEAVGRGRQQVEDVPRELTNLLEELWDDQTMDPTLIRLAMRLNSAQAHGRAVGLATDRTVPERLRLELLGALDELGGPACVPPLLELIGTDESEPLQKRTLSVLDRFPDERIARRVLETYPRLGEPLQAHARDLLFGLKSWALAFLQEIDRGRYPAKEVSTEQLRRIALHEDPELDALIRKHWGSIRPGTPEEKLAEMRRLSNELRAGSGDPLRGQAVFKKRCAVCHTLFGEGKTIGPDLTHANRKDQVFLLASLVDPSSQIRKEYLPWIVQTADGRVLTGLIVESTPASVTLLNAKDERTAVPRNEIELMKESPVSLMPEELHKTLASQELRDLFRFLRQDAPPKAPTGHGMVGEVHPTSKAMK